MSEICTRDWATGTADLTVGMDNVKHVGSNDDFASSFQVGVAAGPCYDGADGLSTWNPQVYVNWGVPFPGSLHSVSTGVKLNYYHALFTEDFLWNVAPSVGTRANFNGGADLAGWRGLTLGVDTGVFWSGDSTRLGPRVGVQGTTSGDLAISAGLDWGWDF